MSLVLWAVSTSRGATMPGKITMSDKPNTGRASGNELEDTRGGASGLPAAPRILINSVSGELMIATFCNLDAGRPKKFRGEKNALRRWAPWRFWTAALPAARRCVRIHSGKLLSPGLGHNQGV